MNNRKDLRHRRQYLLAPSRVDGLKGWAVSQFPSGYVLHTHPDLPVCKSAYNGAVAILAGSILDPDRPESSSQEILDELVPRMRGGISEAINSLGGRWVLFMEEGTRVTALNDACGLRPIFYCFDGEKAWCSSEPGLLSRMTGCERDVGLLKELREAGGYRDREIWWPAPLSGYRDVHRLMPNHYLQMPGPNVRRFWPREPLPRLTVEDCATQLKPLLTNQIRAIARRHPIAMTITAGVDTRTLLASSREMLDRFWLTTWRLPMMPVSAPDLIISQRLVERLGYKVQVLACNEAASKEFTEAYDASYAFAHEYWRDIACNLSRQFPQDHVAVKGHCSEVGRCFFYREGHTRRQITLEKLLGFMRGWNRSPTVREALAAWFPAALEIEKRLGIRVLDLFYWEHRLGCWQANNQVEWDIVHETFCPFSNRKALALMLSASEQERRSDCIHLNLIRGAWDELLDEPINPKPYLTRLRRRIKRPFKRLWAEWKDGF